MAVTRQRGKWVVDFRDKSGRRVQRRSPVQTKRGALQYEAQVKAELEEEEECPSSTSMACSPEGTADGVPTLEAFACDWLTTYVVVNNRKSEVVAKEMILRVHLIPFFDNLTLDTITAKDIEAYKATKLNPPDGSPPLKPKTINNHLTVLRRLLTTAEEWEVIDRVPTIRRLKVPPASFDWLTTVETKRFLRSIDTHYPQWSGLFWLALRTGLRRGELFALEWDDLDLVAGNVRVQRSVYRGTLGPPKNGRERTVPLTDELQDKLRRHRVLARVQCPLVFPSAEGKLTTHQDHADKPLHGALRRVGLRRINFHALRHSFASQLVSAGRTLKEVQELLGHTSIHTTMRYAHLAPERIREAISVLDDRRA